MKNLKTNSEGNHYSFRGATFHIPLPEMHAAIRECMQLYDRLIDDLVAEAKRHAALLVAERNGNSPADLTDGKPMADDRHGRLKT